MHRYLWTWEPAAKAHRATSTPQLRIIAEGKNICRAPASSYKGRPPGKKTPGRPLAAEKHLSGASRSFRRNIRGSRLSGGSPDPLICSVPRDSYASIRMENLFCHFPAKSTQHGRHASMSRSVPAHPSDSGSDRLPGSSYLNPKTRNQSALN